MEAGKGEKKIDRRSRYTRAVIKEALLKLMKEKTVEKITITAVCHLAEINRGTFYLHYLDIYDALSELEEDCLLRLNGLFTEMYDKWGIFQYSRMPSITNGLLHDETVRTLLFHPAVQSKVREQFTTLIKKKTTDGWVKAGYFSRAEAEMVFTFLHAGTSAVNGELAQRSAANAGEELSFLNNLIVRGLRHYIKTAAEF